jgi:hypothetical protein
MRLTIALSSAAVLLGISPAATAAGQVATPAADTFSVNERLLAKADTLSLIRCFMPADAWKKPICRNNNVWTQASIVLAHSPTMQERIRALGLLAAAAYPEHVDTGTTILRDSAVARLRERIRLSPDDSIPHPPGWYGLNALLEQERRNTLYARMCVRTAPETCVAHPSDTLRRSGLDTLWFEVVASRPSRFRLELRPRGMPERPKVLWPSDGKDFAAQIPDFGVQIPFTVVDARQPDSLALRFASGDYYLVFTAVDSSTIQRVRPDGVTKDSIAIDTVALWYSASIELSQLRQLRISSHDECPRKVPRQPGERLCASHAPRSRTLVRALALGFGTGGATALFAGVFRQWQQFDQRVLGVWGGFTVAGAAAGLLGQRQELPENVARNERIRTMNQQFLEQFTTAVKMSPSPVCVSWSHSVPACPVGWTP